LTFLILTNIVQRYGLLSYQQKKSSTSDLDKISGKKILGQGGVLFIKHAKPNFDWGVGVVINNALGYPMIFPSFYLDWQLNGKYELKLSMYDTFEFGVSTQINEHFKIGIVGT
jgi:hypothetical protein